MRVLIVGPSGSGKDKLAEMLAEKANSNVVVSTTTRAKRPGEVDGVDYHFVTPEEFQKRVEENKFLEHAVYGGERYGSEISNIPARFLIVVEPSGIESYNKKYKDILLIALSCPEEIRRERMLSRGDSEAAVSHRLAEDAVVFDEVYRNPEAIIVSSDTDPETLCAEVYNLMVSLGWKN